MRVFVAGGTGAVGRALVPLLVARGHHVTATTTDPGKFGMLHSMGARPVAMDGLDAASVGQTVAAARPEAIINQMTGISVAHGGKPDMKHFDRWFATTNRLRTEGVDHLLAAAAALGVTNVMTQSYSSWNGLREDGWVKTEDDPLDGHQGTAAESGMRAIAHLEEAVVAAGGAALRYGWLYGPGANEALAEPVRKRRFPLVGGGAGHTSWLFLGDAASATVLAMEQRAQGIFNIVDDDPAPAREWLPHLAACAGAKPPMRVPAWLARPLGGELAVRIMTEGRGFSNAKAKRELGWTLIHPSWRQGFAEEFG
ncbi:NAD-dependent epimerase/dehydratase family protein [Paeniglutamicibacter psychrophenolicus]|uniref:Nucleoside-diphosphate-sugar epimerase n=1 Tax=Paeniglutamicibacter psychrophenolicus TaxID=257454 RepID=A0ABS4WH45_9MICC|nr:NAD(P)-dependent oxidoreductase [Paeniglutamicibacter psychrophenolicus]MBP2375326.1 nucleoside-diphosphate-sugar epimerase [Paeniglutamicibacter psychrophenolicus]